MHAENGTWSRARSSLGTGWAWWSAELAALFPRSSAWLAGDGATAVIRLGPQQTEVVVLNRPGSNRELMATWPATLEGLTDDQASELGRLCQGCDITLMLPTQVSLSMSIWLPQAAGATTETVRYALLSRAPLLIDKMAFDWRRSVPSHESTTTDWTDIDVMLCREATLDALADDLARCGLAPGCMSVAGADPDATFTMRRYRRSGANWVGTHRRKLLLGLAMAIFVAGLLVTGLWAQWQERAVTAELTRLQALHRDFAPLAQRQARLEAINAGVARTAAEVLASNVLNELARLTPKDAWLMEVRLEEGRLKAFGRSDKPTELSSRFVQSGVIENVRLDAVNAGVGPDGIAGFELSATARRGR